MGVKSKRPGSFGWICFEKPTRHRGRCPWSGFLLIGQSVRERGRPPEFAGEIENGRDFQAALSSMENFVVPSVFLRLLKIPDAASGPSRIEGKAQEVLRRTAAFFKGVAQCDCFSMDGCDPFLRQPSTRQRPQTSASSPAKGPLESRLTERIVPVHSHGTS